jgi:hypothetical protein
MRKFTYRNSFSMCDEVVEADIIEFESDHVAFWTAGHTKLILAEQNKYVSNLREVEK